jgi:hypothetical protein
MKQKYLGGALFLIGGAHLWTRVFKPKACQGSVDAAGITLSNHNVVVSGAMSGYLLELAP